MRAASPVSTGADAKDAARYRFLRLNLELSIEFQGYAETCLYDDPVKLDEAIDAAMSDEEGKV